MAECAIQSAGDGDDARGETGSVRQYLYAVYFVPGCDSRMVELDRCRWLHAGTEECSRTAGGDGWFELDGNVVKSDVPGGTGDGQYRFGGQRLSKSVPYVVHAAGTSGIQ